MRKLSVLFASVALFCVTGWAQAQKIASLDVATVLNLMPEKKKADEQLAALSNAKRAEIEKQMQTAQNLLKKYSEEAPKQTQQVNEQRNAELQKMQQNIEQLQMAAQKDIAEKTDAAYAPIEKKFYSAVEKVAKANGWEFVVDANNAAFIYRGGVDATAAVKKELGL